MELDKFGRQLRLLELLLDNASLTTQQLCERMGLSRRSVYRYLEFFRMAGFDVMEENGIYSIGLSSPFFNGVAGRMRLGSAEVEALAQLLSKADNSNPVISRLQYKLRSMYGVAFSQSSAQVEPRIAENTDALRKAIAKKRKVVLHNYYSPHGKTTSNRLVEPFRLLPTTGDVRCYEEMAGQCKTFKISRIGGRVEVLDDHWTAQRLHAQYYTDLFGFSGETTHRITLRLGPLASRILMEDFGVKDVQMAIDDDGLHRLYSLNVCSYQGVGRFVLGLISDIEVLRGTEFKNYLRKTLNEAIKKIER